MKIGPWGDGKVLKMNCNIPSFQASAKHFCQWQQTSFCQWNSWGTAFWLMNNVSSDVNQCSSPEGKRSSRWSIRHFLDQLGMSYTSRSGKRYCPYYRRSESELVHRQIYFQYREAYSCAVLILSRHPTGRNVSGQKLLPLPSDQLWSASNLKHFPYY